MPESVQIVNYKPIYRDAFKSLNEEWIKKYFKMEAADHKALDNPQENIVDKGGYIAVALLKGEPVGVCALIKMNHGPFDYELAKMGVSPKAQGMGIGYQLGSAIIKKAKGLGAKNIFLESNRRLKPALHLYKKLNFVEIEEIDTPYARSDIQMVLEL